MRRAAITALVVAGLAAPAAHADVLVALKPSALVPADARPVAASLGIWRVPSAEAKRMRGVIAVGPDRRMRRFERATPSDPLLPQEWWWTAVGADRAQPPPGAGTPVAVIDTGVDVTHPELSALNVLLLDPQHVTPGAEEHHGTAVASIVAAPADGKGMVGVYPGASLASYDAGGQTLAEVLGGIATAIQQPGPGVINLSVGFDGSSGADLLRVGVDAAFAAGWLVVAAAGNGGQDGSPPVYPADLPHVLTVAATDRNGDVAPFSSRSRFVDLAAPGVSILAAVPTWRDPTGFAQLTGTSFSAPIVAGAAAWLWTARPHLDNTQVMAILRRSALDLGTAGPDPASGWGLLNIPSALATPSPIRDPQEPNDDVPLVAEDGEFGVGTEPLVDAGRRRTRVAAQLDPNEDPADVYRVFVPYGREVVATVRSGKGVRLDLWGTRTASIHERKPAALRDLIGTGTSVRTRNVSQRKGGFYYVAASLAPGATGTDYLVSVELRAPR